jgi:hypothetical protein
LTLSPAPAAPLVDGLLLQAASRTAALAAIANARLTVPWFTVLTLLRGAD